MSIQIIKNQSEIDACLLKVHDSAELARTNVWQLVNAKNPFDFLYQMKFTEIGFDPMNSARKLNLIEQLNQTFTYVASFMAASYLLKSNPPFSSLTLNLGTASGWDIESDENGGLIAEVFASVNPDNNNKLSKDIKKVAEGNVEHRYVFFMCPGIEPGIYNRTSIPKNIHVVSLGCDMLKR